MRSLGPQMSVRDNFRKRGAQLTSESFTVTLCSPDPLHLKSHHFDFRPKNLEMPMALTLEKLRGGRNYGKKCPKFSRKILLNDNLP